jgi:hypothetical protein
VADRPPTEIVRDHVRHFFRIVAECAIDFLGEIGTAVTRYADDVDEMKTALKVTHQFEVARQQSKEYLVGARDAALAGFRGHDTLGVAARPFDDIAVLLTQFLGQLVMPAGIVEGPVVDDMHQEIHEHRRNRNLAIGQFYFHAHLPPPSRLFIYLSFPARLSTRRSSKCWKLSSEIRWA